MPVTPGLMHSTMVLERKITSSPLTLCLHSALSQDKLIAAGFAHIPGRCHDQRNARHTQQMHRTLFSPPGQSAVSAQICRTEEQSTSSCGRQGQGVRERVPMRHSDRRARRRQPVPARRNTWNRPNFSFQSRCNLGGRLGRSKLRCSRLGNLIRGHSRWGLGQQNRA